MLYNNKNYTVQLAEGGTEYTVNNKETGVIEFTSQSLPRCIIVAEESDTALNRFLPEEKEPIQGNVKALFPGRDK